MWVRQCPFGPFGVTRVDQQHQLAVGADQLPELVLGVRVVEGAHDDLGQVHGDDLAQHADLDGQGPVPGPLQDQVVEPLRGLRPGVGVPEGLVALHQADQVLDAGVQVVQVLLGAPGREQARRGGLGGHARLVHVGDRRPAHLEQQSDIPGRHGDVRGHHPRPAPGAAADADEGFGLQDPERLAQRRPGYAEHLHQHGFRRQRVAGLQVAADDLPADVRRDQLGRLGCAQDRPGRIARGMHPTKLRACLET